MNDIDKINQIREDIYYNSKVYNRYKEESSSSSFICVITGVNEKKFTADVFIPVLSTKMNNITIATNMIGAESSLVMLPSPSQKGIILLSSQHEPLLIATIPDLLTENNLLVGETKMGTNSSFVKISKDKSLSMRSLTASLSLKDDEQKVISKSTTVIGSGFSKKCDSGADINSIGNETELFFNIDLKNKYKEKSMFIKDKAIDNDLKLQVLQENTNLLYKFNTLIESVEIFNTNIELGDSSIIDDLKELKKSIINEYNSDIKSDCLIIEKGDTDTNKKDSSVLSIKYKKDGIEKGSFYFDKDGIIRINCKDLIINKEG